MIYLGVLISVNQIKNYEEKGVTHALTGTFSQKYRAEQIPSFLAFQHCLCLPALLHHYCPAKSCYHQQSLKRRICRNYSSTPRLSYLGFLKASINLISVVHMPLYTHSSRFCCHPQPVLRPQIIWSQDTSLDEKVLPVLSCQSYSEDSTLENLQSCENWLLYEQEIQQMVIMWPGIASGPAIYIYAFIMLHYSPLCSGLFSPLWNIAMSVVTSLSQKSWFCQDCIADCYRSSPNLTKILLCQDFQILQRTLLINLLLSKWWFFRSH